MMSREMKKSRQSSNEVRRKKKRQQQDPAMSPYHVSGKSRTIGCIDATLETSLYIDTSQQKKNQKRRERKVNATGERKERGEERAKEAASRKRELSQLPPGLTAMSSKQMGTLGAMTRA